MNCGLDETTSRPEGRCVFCDIIAQELQQSQRVIEVRGDFVALCPYAPRAPYETWILPRSHEAAFERYGLSRPATMLDLASLLRRTLQQFTVTGEFHLVLHSFTILCSVPRALTIGRQSTTTTTGILKFCR